MNHHLLPGDMYVLDRYRVIDRTLALVVMTHGGLVTLQIPAPKPDSRPVTPDQVRGHLVIASPGGDERFLAKKRRRVESAAKWELMTREREQRAADETRHGE